MRLETPIARLCLRSLQGAPICRRHSPPALPPSLSNLRAAIAAKRSLSGHWGSSAGGRNKDPAPGSSRSLGSPDCRTSGSVEGREIPLRQGSERRAGRRKEPQSLRPAEAGSGAWRRRRLSLSRRQLGSPQREASLLEKGVGVGRLPGGGGASSLSLPFSHCSSDASALLSTCKPNPLTHRPPPSPPLREVKVTTAAAAPAPPPPAAAAVLNLRGHPAPPAGNGRNAAAPESAKPLRESRRSEFPKLRDEEEEEKGEREGDGLAFRGSKEVMGLNRVQAVRGSRSGFFSRKSSPAEFSGGQIFSSREFWVWLQAPTLTLVPSWSVGLQPSTSREHKVEECCLSSFTELALFFLFWLGAVTTMYKLPGKEQQFKDFSHICCPHRHLCEREATVLAFGEPCVHFTFMECAYLEKLHLLSLDILCTVEGCHSNIIKHSANASNFKSPETTAKHKFLFL
ncbi:uncharacterized protein LOC134401264 [Elgaria multicarinata webbii]|uniref:uncharacterized protein LOC134401264 n=1 Tax=Elgaria multicarinata webbii TaxID=159646 RepID=UPI002FCCF12D